MLRIGAKVEVRPIRVGARIEHPQRLIDIGRYGQERGELPPASYRFVSKPKKVEGHIPSVCVQGERLLVQLPKRGALLSMA